MMNIHTATALSATAPIVPAGDPAPSSTAAGALYPADLLAKASEAFLGKRVDVGAQVGLSDAEKQHIVSELDTADKLAGLAMLCQREGDTVRANQYMQEATDIRKAVEPELTGPQQQQLEQIMSLEKDALQRAGNHNWITGIFDQFKSTAEMAEANGLSQQLRNSVLASGQVLAAS